MESSTVRAVHTWFETHPAAAEGDVSALLSRCERAVRRHAEQDAWIAARRYVEERRHDWEGREGAHASEAYVAREVCGQLAHELREHEPEVKPEAADHLAGGPVRDAVAPEAWEVLVPWIVKVAREQEHETWLEIVRHTNRRARQLIREHHLSDDCSFDHSRCYDEVAVRIARLLERDFSEHAFPRA